MTKELLAIVAPENELAAYRNLPFWETGEVVYLALDLSLATSPHLAQASLLLLDCGECERDGLELLKAVKIHHSDIPVIFLTKVHSEETIITAFRLGARDYFKKPCDLLELKQTIDRLLPLRRRSGEPRARLWTGNEEGAILGRLPSDLPSNIQRVVARIMKDLHLNLSVDLLAREACLSKFHFCRVFKEIFGTSPMDYVMRLRIERAKVMLRMRLPIIQVAMKTGFNDASNFSRQFRRLTGMSPSVYRSSQQTSSFSPPRR